MRLQKLLQVLALVCLLIALLGASLSICGCDSSKGADGLSDDSGNGAQSGNVEGRVGETIPLGDANITVEALEETFQPKQPSQRLSTKMAESPGAGESLYQAHIRVQNLGVTPLRVDPLDFICLIGERLVSIEPALSGPLARSILRNASIDFVLTYKAKAGLTPELYYNPAWYDGTIKIVIDSMGAEESGGGEEN